MSAAVEHKWWATTWGRVTYGDHVRAPDGSAWRVAVVLDSGAFHMEFAITRGDRVVWSKHNVDEEVQAARIPVRPANFDQEDTAIAALRMTGFDVS